MGADHPTTRRDLPMQIRTAKIDRSTRKVSVDFSRMNGGTPEDVKFSCPDSPTKPFVTAMNALAGDFCFIMELPKEVHDRVSVHGVHFGEKGGRETFQILGGLSVEAGYSSLNTPLLWAPSEDGSGMKASVTEEQAKRLVKVRIEAAKYVDGNRTQIEMGLEDEKQEQEEVAPV